MTHVFHDQPLTDDIQQSVLESIALREPLQTTFDKACNKIESSLGDAICCIMMLDGQRESLNVASGPSLSREVIEGLNGLVPGPKAASCGTAAFTGKPVIVEDTTVSPYWDDFQDNVKRFGIRSCWSYPILAVGSKQSLGTFAICHGNPATPSDEDLHLLGTVAQLIGIAVQRQKLDDELRESQQALIEIAEGVSGQFGRGFLKSLTKRLADVLKVDYAMIGERLPQASHMARTIAVIADCEPQDDFEFELSGTPCNEVLANDLYYCPSNLRDTFPNSQLLADLNADSYMGIVLRDGDQRANGWISVLSRGPMQISESMGNVFRAFAARAAAELERARVESNLSESESRYRSLYHSMPLMSESIDYEGRLVNINEQWLKTMGYERDEVIGRHVTDFHTQDSRNRAIETWLPLYFAGKPIEDVPFEMVSKDGRVVPVLITAWLEPKGSSHGASGHAVLRDVSERHNHQAELDRLNTALDNALLGVSKLDTDGIYEMVSPTYARILGYQPEELVGQSWRVTVPTDKQHKTAEAAERMLVEGSADLENEGLRKDGSVYYKHCLLVGSLNSRGEVDGFYCFMKDISERVKAEAHRRELENQLRQSQKLEAVGTLASGVAHDINNTLTAVFGFAEQAKRQMDAPVELGRSIDMIEQAAEQAASVTRSLLTFAQKTSTEKEAIRLDQLVIESMRLLRRLLPASIELTEEIDTSMPIWIEADRNQIQQVLMNLTINARHAMVDSGRLRVKLRIDDGAVLSVEDTGAGMAPDIQQRIFEPFFTTKDRGQGTGLGLSVVHGIISDHGGTIEVHSVQNQGTRFDIRFPLSAASSTSATEHANNTTSNPSNSHHRRMLIAEDDELVAAVMAATFESEGFDVTLANTGDEAIRMIDEQTAAPDVVILDFDLPGRTGDECRRHLRQRNRHVPVVIVTGNTNAYLSAQSTDAATNETGVPDHEKLVAKPFRMNELVEDVRSLLQKSDNR